MYLKNAKPILTQTLISPVTTLGTTGCAFRPLNFRPLNFRPLSLNLQVSIETFELDKVKKLKKKTETMRTKGVTTNCNFGDDWKSSNFKI